MLDEGGVEMNRMLLGEGGTMKIREFERRAKWMERNWIIGKAKDKMRGEGWN